VTVFLHHLWANPAYTIFIAFLCAHPLASGLASMFGAVAFRRRGGSSRWYVATPETLQQARQRFPTISVVIPAHSEGEVIEEAVRGVLRLQWPRLDVIVVDDGSGDDTRARVRPFLADGRVRLLHKPVNEGKSMAINDALPICRGDLVLLMDADGIPDPTALEQMAPHFVRGGKIAAVTGNPRVLNTRTVLTRLQAIEFTSTVGVQRRGDSVWGRLMTVSGLCVLFDRGVVQSLHGFAPDMATEDIDLSWRLQLAGYDVVYEPSALFGMEAPESLRSLWRQRRRWVLGLAQVLRRHLVEALHHRNWRLWPVALSATLSIVWAHALVIATAVVVVAAAAGAEPHGLPQLLGLFGAITILAGIVQGVTGMWLDRKNDPAIWRQLPWVCWYPLVYWALCVLLVVRGTLPGLVRRPKLSVWNIPREQAEPGGAAALG
jgi:biofilm PGA synthesis N-glycosyltransferase PgaC